MSGDSMDDAMKDPRIKIDSTPMSDSFLEVWVAAGKHLTQWDERGLVWLRRHPYPPFLEHLSFRLGNQLFFVRVVDASSQIEAPGTLGGLHRVTVGNGGHGCLLPMVHTPQGWQPQYPHRGLISPRDQSAIVPGELATDDIIPMSDWEVHDLAIKVARECIEASGRTVYSRDSDPDVDPSLWFIDHDGKPAWVLVRAARHPACAPKPPLGWYERARHFSGFAYRGYFAPVQIANDKDPFRPFGWGALPLWRGFKCRHNLTGLVPLYDPNEIEE